VVTEDMAVALVMRINTFSERAQSWLLETIVAYDKNFSARNRGVFAR